VTGVGEESARASDADRETAVAALREHLLAGRLTPEEFSDRVGEVLAGRVAGDLARAQKGLPDVYGAAAPGRKPARLAAALFGHIVRRGRLRLGRHTVAVSVLGDLDLDLREATIDGPRAALTVLLVAGNADIYLPEGIDVEVTGITIFGHCRDLGRDIASPDSPAVRIRVYGVFPTVDVWRVPPAVRGSYDQIIQAIKKRERELPGAADRPAD
jgi:hypothetical protein